MSFPLLLFTNIIVETGIAEQEQSDELMTLKPEQNSAKKKNLAGACQTQPGNRGFSSPR